MDGELKFCAWCMLAQWVSTSADGIKLQVPRSLNYQAFFINSCFSLDVKISSNSHTMP